MNQPNLPQAQIVDTTSVWELALRPAGCPQCRQVFLVAAERVQKRCPQCGQGMLAMQPALMRPEPPEQILPFARQPADLGQALHNFANFWLGTADLTGPNLQQRLTPMYWPMWLVDADVVANWQGEVGFNYQVKSSRESYAGGQWRTDELIKTRIRWEPRVGQLQRHYANTPVPALAQSRPAKQPLWAYPVGKAQPFDPRHLNGALVHVPDLPPEGAWPRAEGLITQRAAEECQQAAGAQHMRNYTTQAQYTMLNWTQLLLPLYVTWYKNDAGEVHLVHVNGSNGTVSGKRFASPKQGWTWAGGIGAVAFAIFVLGLLCLLGGLVFPPLLVLGGLIALVSFVVGLAALIPLFRVWSWNNGQRSS